MAGARTSTKDSDSKPDQSEKQGTPESDQPEVESPQASGPQPVVETQAVAEARAAGGKTYTLEEGTPDGVVERGVIRGDGSYVGQLLSKAEDKSLEKAQKVANEYMAGRERCPRCGVVDGVVKGEKHCNSCGGSWK